MERYNLALMTLYRACDTKFAPAARKRLAAKSLFEQMKHLHDALLQDYLLPTVCRNKSHYSRER